MNENIYKKRLGFLVLGTIVLIFAGVLYAWANLSTPLYDLGWSETAITLNYTITVLAFAAGGVVSGILSKKLSVRARLIPSALLLIGGFWISSTLKEGSSIIILYLSYGIMSGLGIGIAYNTVVSAVNLWFPDKSGFSSGILLFGFGIGSFFISLLAGKLMASGLMHWRTIYRVLAFVCGIVIFTGAVIIRQPGKNTILPVASNADHVVSEHDYTPTEMITTGAFWLSFFAHAFLAGIGNSIIPVSKNLLLSIEMSESAVILISSSISIVNSIGRIAAGELIDIFSLRTARVFSCIVAIAGCVFGLFGLIYANAVICTIGMFLCAFSYGFPSTLQTTTSLEFYGKKNYSLNYSILNSDTAICALFPTIFTSISLAVGKSYIGGFYFLIATGLVTLVISAIIHRPKYVENNIAVKEDV